MRSHMLHKPKRPETQDTAKGFCWLESICTWSKKNETNKARLFRIKCKFSKYSPHYFGNIKAGYRTDMEIEAVTDLVLNIKSLKQQAMYSGERCIQIF